jgi:hypothetical protein
MILIDLMITSNYNRVLISSYTYSYKFSNSLLDVTEVTASRFIVWLPDDSLFVALHRTAADSLQPPQLPDSVASQLKGSANFVTNSELAVTISNPTDSMIVKIQNVFRGPSDESKPVTWKRTCDTEIRLGPHQTREFSCQIEPVVDLKQGWQWENISVWGLPR